MAYSNFKPLVWSKHIQRELEKATVLQEDCNTEFEGEARQGSRVKILGVARPTIGDYTGQNIGAPEDVPTRRYILTSTAPSSSTSAWTTWTRRKASKG